LEKLLIENNQKLFSLESQSALDSFDILGFTVQCELVAANILNILSLSRIQIFAKDRTEKNPLIIGGGPALTNPEPFCDFFDLFVLGDGETVMPEIIKTCKENKKLKKVELLRKLAGIEGVYVPSFYEVSYNEDGTIKSVKAAEGVKQVVKKATINLKDTYFPDKKIVPFVETVHNRLNIEVARGCPGQCRFCQASKYYRPWRERGFEDLLELVKKGVAATGYEEAAFSSLSCSDYRHLDKLLVETNKLYGDSKLNISLPSLRCNEHSLKVAQYINRSKRPTLTFAPEAGTDRLRNVIGKYLSEKQIVHTLLAANAMGWKTIKLYFMIGLPTETDEDLAGINDLVRAVRLQAKGLNFNITVSPFVPKAQTAFQWFPMASPESIKAKIDYLHKLLPAAVKAHNYRASILEAFIAKGNRRTAQVIYKAWQKGARFEQWADKFGNDIWSQAIKESGLDLDFFVYREIPQNEILPWEHLNFGVSKSDLYADYLKGKSEKCEVESGINDKAGESLLPENYVEPVISVEPPVLRMLLKFSKLGAVKFVSHLEQIEVFRRAARRSGLPVAFTAGFSPQVKSSYGPPVSVGWESECEYMELYFTRKISADQIKSKISEALPEGFKIIEAKRVPLSFPAIDVLANVAEYEIAGADIRQSEIDAVLSQKEIILEKTKKGKTVQIDAKPLIRGFKSETGSLKLLLRFGSGKSVKPELILNKLLENRTNYATIYEIKRKNLYIETKNGQLYLP